MDDGDGDVARRYLRGRAGVVTSERLRVRGRFAVAQDILGIASARRRKLKCVAVELYDAKIGGCRRVHNERVARGRAEGVFAGLEPFQADEREPAVGSLQVLRLLGAPGEQVRLPGGAGWVGSSGEMKERQQKGERGGSPWAKRAEHGESCIIRRGKCESKKGRGAGVCDRPVPTLSPKTGDRMGHPGR